MDIYRYHLRLLRNADSSGEAAGSVEMPSVYEDLSYEVEEGRIVLWAEIDESAPVTTRNFVVKWRRGPGPTPSGGPGQTLVGDIKHEPTDSRIRIYEV